MTQGLWASPPQMMVAMAFSFASPIIPIRQNTGTKQQTEGRQQAMEIRHIRRDASRQAMGDAPGSGQRSGNRLLSASNRAFGTTRSRGCLGSETGCHERRQAAEAASKPSRSPRLNQPVSARGGDGAICRTCEPQSGNVPAGMSRRLHRRRQSRPDSRCIRRRARSVIPLSVGHSDVGSLLQSVEPGRLAVQSHAAKTCTDCGPRGNFPLDVCVRQI